MILEGRLCLIGDGAFPCFRKGEARMRRDEAEERTRTAGREKNFLAETWYCGIINRKIEEAVEKGQYEAKIRFSARSYPARHQQRFIEL